MPGIVAAHDGAQSPRGSLAGHSEHGRSNRQNVRATAGFLQRLATVLDDAIRGA